MVIYGFKEIKRWRENHSIKGYLQLSIVVTLFNELEYTFFSLNSVIMSCSSQLQTCDKEIY
jgi:hypothetical protein